MERGSGQRSTRRYSLASGRTSGILRCPAGAPLQCPASLEARQEQSDCLNGHLFLPAPRNAAVYRICNRFDEHATQQIRIDLGPDDGFDEGDRKRERVRFVRRFGLNLSDQILNSLETLHGSQFTDRSAVPPTFRRRTSWARSTSGA
jgi:hypothetical protein